MATTSTKGNTAGTRASTGDRSGPMYAPAAPSTVAPTSTRTIPHWYPKEDQLHDPSKVANSFRVMLDQFYALQDKLDSLQGSHDALAAKVNTPSSGPPPGSGPTDSKICGLNVAPVDTSTLANGAALKYNSKTGNFSFQ